MRDDDNGSGDDLRFVAVIDHPLGQTRSNPLDGKTALKVAATWSKHGDGEVRIEQAVGAQRWTLAAFKTHLGSQTASASKEKRGARSAS